jgi:DNA-binding NtrC family response regulator
VINSRVYKYIQYKRHFFKQRTMATAVKDHSSEINVVIIGETGTGRNKNSENLFSNRCSSRTKSVRSNLIVRVINH